MDLRPTGPAGHPRFDSRRAGVTLVELVVVLVLLGLVVGLALPRLLPEPEAKGAGVDAAVEAARRAAIRRAGAVVLSIESDGRWTVSAENEPDAAPLHAGRLAGPSGAPLRVHVSALGACVPARVVAGEPSYTLDPIRCRVLHP